MLRAIGLANQGKSRGKRGYPTSATASDFRRKANVRPCPSYALSYPICPSANLLPFFLFDVFSLSSRLDSRSCQASYLGARDYSTTPLNKITPLTRSKHKGGRQDCQRIPTRRWRDTAFGSCSTRWLLDRCNNTIPVLQCCASRTDIRRCASTTSCLVLIGRRQTYPPSIFILVWSKMEMEEQ